MNELSAWLIQPVTFENWMFFGLLLCLAFSLVCWICTMFAYRGDDDTTPWHIVCLPTKRRKSFMVKLVDSKTGKNLAGVYGSANDMSEIKYLSRHFIRPKTKIIIEDRQ